MAEKRFNRVFGIFGDRGTGKTEFAKGNPDLNLPGLINVYLKRGRKVFIIDTIDHPAWRHYPVLMLKDLGKFKKGAVRIICNAEDIPHLNRVLANSPAIYNALLLYEDARKHTYYKVDRSMMSLIGDSKQKDTDIGFMYHCFAHCPLDLYRYFDFIELFKTKDTPLVRKDAFAGNLNEVMEVHRQVKANQSRFHHQTIYTGTD